MHMLDNPIWTALSTRQAYIAKGGGWARRFPPEITALAGFPEPSEQAYAALSKLADRSPAALFLAEPPKVPEGWSRLLDTELVQMVYEDGAAAPSRHEWVELGVEDVPEMVPLAERTQPGPFGARTYQLGTYLGIRQNGKLVAMAGERLCIPGYVEISAVCTHPDHVGKGYAASLMSVLIEKLRRHGEIPFLHVRAQNARAIALYERLGFRTRFQFHLAVVQMQRDSELEEAG